MSIHPGMGQLFLSFGLTLLVVAGIDCAAWQGRSSSGTAGALDQRKPELLAPIEFVDFSVTGQVTPEGAARLMKEKLKIGSAAGDAYEFLVADTRTLQRLHKQLERLDLLLLDELGYVPSSKAGAELLFEVVSRAYERTSLLVTTNLPFAQWTEVLGSERLTGALLDRLTHRVHILEANGQSYRLQDAKGRLKRK